MDIERAIEVLGLAQHRGARVWCWDAKTRRVMPAQWNGRSAEPAPAFTVFEAVTIARGLERIGVAGPGLLHSVATSTD